MTTLEEWMIEAGAPPIPVGDDEARAAYRIGAYGNPLGEADWAARELQKAQRQIEAVRREADRQISQVNEWGNAECARHQPDVDYFDGLLTRWWQSEMSGQLDEAGNDWSKVRAKTQNLPSGAKVSASKTPAALTVTGPELFLRWLQRARSELVEWTPAVKVAEAKKVLVAGPAEPVGLEPWATAAPAQDPATGEVVPGVEFTSRVTFEVGLP